MRIAAGMAYFLRLMWVVPLRGLAYIWPRSARHVVFGSWMGNLYLDNPKYLCEYLLKNSDLKITCTWIGNDVVRDVLPHHPNIKFAKKGSLYAFFMLLHAKTWVCCQAWNIDLTTLPIKGRATIIDTWHGIPVKFVGLNAAMNQGWLRKRSPIKRLLTRLQYEEEEWLLVSSEKMARILTSGVPNRYSMRRILPFGTPRNDFLLQNRQNLELIQELKHKYAELLGFDATKRVVLYLPTWRMRGDCVFAFYNQPRRVQTDWRRLLGDNGAVLIEKHHYGTYEKYPMTKPSECSIVVTADQQKNVDVQELMLVADLMISDYSGAYIDYALLRRPIVHFVYDFEEYARQDSGLAYDLEKVAAGQMVQRLGDLMPCVEKLLQNPVSLPAERFHELVEFEHGTSCKQIVDFILKQKQRCSE